MMRGALEAASDKDKEMASDSKMWFVHFAQWVSHVTGRPLAFIAAVVLILMWGVSGPIFGFSDTWQLVINTTTTIVTFLMVFVIQNTQNRDTAAMHIKIDELIRVSKGARNVLLDLEELDDKTLETLRKDHEKLASTAKSRGQPRSPGKVRKADDA
jgi:low affinity Fe/Cu permease